MGSVDRLSSAGTTVLEAQEFTAIKKEACL